MLRLQDIAAWWQSLRSDKFPLKEPHACHYFRGAHLTLWEKLRGYHEKDAHCCARYERAKPVPSYRQVVPDNFVSIKYAWGRMVYQFNENFGRNAAVGYDLSLPSLDYQRLLICIISSLTEHDRF